MKGASSSTATIIGGVFGGPAGAIAGGAAADNLITQIDSAINKEYTPFGIVHYASNIDKVSAGDHFDQWLDIGKAFAGRKTEKKSKVEKN